MSPVPTLGWGSPRLQGCRTIFTEISLILWGGEEKTQTLQESARCSASTGCQLLALLVSLELLRGKRGQLGSLSRDEANPLTSRAERRWIFFFLDPRLVLPPGFACPLRARRGVSPWCHRAKLGAQTCHLPPCFQLGLAPGLGRCRGGRNICQTIPPAPLRAVCCSCNSSPVPSSRILCTTCHILTCSFTHPFCREKTASRFKAAGTR